MSIVIAGYGPGIAHAVALKFGKERGHSVALLARTQSKLDSAVTELKSHGIKAVAFAVDLADTDAVLKAIQDVQKELGEVSILFWNGGGYPKAALEATSEDIHTNLRINIDSLLFATKAVQKDLEKNKGAVLVTGGGLGLDNDVFAQVAVDWGATTYALNKAAQQKLVHILHLTLKPLGIFVGEVTVVSQVKFTTFDPEGKSDLTTEDVANAFADLFDKRDKPFVLSPPEINFKQAP